MYFYTKLHFDTTYKSDTLLTQTKSLVYFDELVTDMIHTMLYKNLKTSEATLNKECNVSPYFQANY